MCVCVMALGTTSVTSLRNVRCMHPQAGVQCHVGEGAAKMNSHPKGERLAEAVNIPKAHPNVGEAQLPRPMSGARQRKYLRGRSIRAVSRNSTVKRQLEEVGDGLHAEDAPPDEQQRNFQLVYCVDK